MTCFFRNADTIIARRLSVVLRSCTTSICMTIIVRVTLLRTWRPNSARDVWIVCWQMAADIPVSEARQVFMITYDLGHSSLVWQEIDEGKAVVHQRDELKGSFRLWKERPELLRKFIVAALLELFQMVLAPSSILWTPSLPVLLLRAPSMGGTFCLAVHTKHVQ